jgi:paraquat-inducible protein A
VSAPELEDAAAKRAVGSTTRSALVLALFLACAVTLAFGLTEPVITVDRLIFGKVPYTVWGGVKGLWDDQSPVLAVIVFLFSFVTPIAKLVLLGWLWVAPSSAVLRAKSLAWMESLGRWSMLDVFAVAILIVANKMQVKAEAGIYWFCAAILLSMALTTLVRKLGR